MIQAIEKTSRSTSYDNFIDQFFLPTNTSDYGIGA